MRFALPALLLGLAACSLSGRMRDAQPTPPPGPDQAKVIVYRTSPIGESAHFPVYEVTDEGGRLLGFTETDCYFEYTCPPGVHLFLAWEEGEAVVEADLEPGKTYFIQAYSKFGVLAPRPGLAPVGKGSERWAELEEVLPSLRCRRLDPAQAAEFKAGHTGRFEEAHRAYVEGKRAPRVIRPDDGAEESALPAK
jgi:hypothetical protein